MKTPKYYEPVSVEDELPVYCESEDNVYFVLYADGAQGGTKGEVFFNGVAFESTYGKVTHWLRPTEIEEVDAGEFAEWLGKNGWRHHEHSMFWNGGKDFKTTSELLQLFRQKGGEG